jgi:hypothetical protein
MATGFLFNARCYPTAAEATSAHWSQDPVSITPGGTSYIADVVWSGSAWVIKKYTLSSTGVLTLNSTTTAPALSFESCDTISNFKDGAQIGAGVAGAIVIAFLIRILGWGTK